MKHALTLERLNDRIIPVIIEPCRIKKISWVLEQYQSIDLRPDFAAGLRQLQQRMGLASTSQG